jgi:hypothetical protein
VPDEPALREALALVERAGIRYAPFHEPDCGDELTAIATEPVFGRRRSVFRRFPLLTEQPMRHRPPAAWPADSGPARSSFPDFSGGSAMSSDSVIPVVAFRTSFGMYVPCDRERYRKLKRIRHLAAFAEAERRRWDRSQRRLPHNRAFKRRRGGRVVREAVDAARMIFAPFYELPPADPSLGLPPDARPARETGLLPRFLADYHGARRPVPDAAAVRPPALTIAEVNALLERIEVWNLRR